MEKFTNINQLMSGKKFYVLSEGKVILYKFLCIHPENDKYILALDDIEKEGKKLFIPNLLGETISHPEVYVGEYDSAFILQRKADYHRKKAERYEKRIEELKER